MKHLEPDVIEALARGTVESSEHLASCPECRAHVARARGRQKLLGAMTPYTLSDLGFRRVEARLNEAVAAGDAEPTSWRWLWMSLGAAAAVALAFVFFTSSDATNPSVLLPQPKPLVSQAPFHALTVVRSKAAQARLGTADWHPLRAGDVVRAGEALSADSITLAPAQDVGWAFVAAGSLSLGGAATITLGAGEVLAKVSAPVELLASSRRLLASEALFSVSRVGAEVVLNVAEGRVDVVDSLTGERRALQGPVALRWSDGSGLADARQEPVRALRAPSVPAQPWTQLDASLLSAGTEVSLDGLDLGAAPFLELVTAGRRRLGLTPPGGVRRESWAELMGGQPFGLRPELPSLETDGPEPDAAALERVMAELKRQRPKLSACYEKWLKANPNASGDVTLELSVSAQGRVKAARVLEGTISPASAECLATTARSLVLPPLGADATLEVPLVLRPPGH